ncbi:uncharacterized protein LOC113856026 [Abrus precatorius]|uniref:Uncharacterized protein LOC113856026 n=1 Tax=Abrus precatorius TaxID=3816 RepID=A0A8B8KKT1_ABRPR|nr:uncharacterized protein LOC113856026 [Abrus precatorius]
METETHRLNNRNMKRFRHTHVNANLRCHPKLCRLFLRTKHCPYGRSCRYLHLHIPVPISTSNAPQHTTLQTPTNSSTTPLHNAFAVKRFFNKNELQRNSRIYADWINSFS